MGDYSELSQAGERVWWVLDKRTERATLDEVQETAAEGQNRHNYREQRIRFRLGIRQQAICSSR